MMDIINHGGPIMVPLLLCSLVSLTVILERMFYWIEIEKQQDVEDVARILQLCRQCRWSQAEELSSESANLIIRILNQGIIHRQVSLTKAMESQAKEEISKMRQRMGVLDTIITAAPLLGIFGTVLGIIVSFDLLGAGIKDPSAITAGISQALITTASGLGIAVLTLFPYNYLIAKIDKTILRIEQSATELEIIKEIALVKQRKTNRGFRNFVVTGKIGNEAFN